MGWPEWIDELAQRYLADEGNVFLLHGAVHTDVPHDGALRGVAEVLAAFLARTRGIVGIVRPGRAITFPKLEDRSRFEQIVAAQDLFQAQRTPQGETEIEQALARVWVALGSTTHAQGWILADMDQVAPGHRKRVEELGSATPPLVEWARDARITASNHLVIMLAPTTESVRADVAASAIQIRVGRARPAPPPTPAPPPEPVLPVDTPEADPAEAPTMDPAPSADPEPPRPAAPAPTSEIGEELRSALVRALIAHPETSRAARVPVMDAVAQVVHGLAPDRCGALTFGVDDDGVPWADGPGEEWFMERWRGDIALDAAAGMLIKDLGSAGGFSEQRPPPLSDTALRALERRIARMLR